VRPDPEIHRKSITVLGDAVKARQHGAHRQRRGEPHVPRLSGNCTADIPYSYSSVVTSNTNDVKTTVPGLVGVGKI